MATIRAKASSTRGVFVHQLDSDDGLECVKQIWQCAEELAHCDEILIVFGPSMGFDAPGCEFLNRLAEHRRSRRFYLKPLPEDGPALSVWQFFLPEAQIWEGSAAEFLEG